jgi:thiol:disulfide interchange protein
MLHFRTALAFPMFATVVWLVWVIGQQTGIDGVAALLGVLLALAFLLWALGTVGLGRKTRVVLGSAAGGVMVAALAWAWPALPLNADTPARAAAASDDGWSAWSPAAVAAARAQARPVLVDFTAAWCVTCQFNKRTALANDAVVADFRARGVVLLRADWTRRDADITRELTRLGRTGVPVYALYGPGAPEPELLSEVLTAAGIREAMARWPAAGTRAAAASPPRSTR